VPSQSLKGNTAIDQYGRFRRCDVIATGGCSNLANSPTHEGVHDDHEHPSSSCDIPGVWVLGTRLEVCYIFTSNLLVGKMLDSSGSSV
jgi:hypothetical protein